MTAPEPERPTPNPPEVRRRVVIRARPNEHWGFLQPRDALLNDRSAHVFYHHSCVRGRPLREGEEVLYTLSVTEDGRLRAVDVTRTA